MAVTVRIPTPLRQFTGGADEVEAQGNSVGEVLRSLCAQCNGVAERIFKDDNSIHRFVNVFLNEEDIRFLDDLGTAVKDGDELSIVPAIAGG